MQELIPQACERCRVRKQKVRDLHQLAVSFSFHSDTDGLSVIESNPNVGSAGKPRPHASSDGWETCWTRTIRRLIIAILNL
jgi:hypothetical protein